MSWLYRPNHPLADEFGMVEKHMVMPAESKTTLYVISDTMPHMKHPGTGACSTARPSSAGTRERRAVSRSGLIRYSTGKATSAVSTAEYVQDVKRAIQELNSR
jgi:hypothetical protein